MSKKLSIKNAFNQSVEKDAEKLRNDPDFQKTSDEILKRIHEQRPETKRREVPAAFEEVTEKADRQKDGSDGIGLGE